MASMDRSSMGEALADEVDTEADIDAVGVVRGRVFSGVEISYFQANDTDSVDPAFDVERKVFIRPSDECKRYPHEAVEAGGGPPSRRTKTWVRDARSGGMREVECRGHGWVGRMVDVCF